jgi:NAD-dependent DNA ligase
MTQKENLTNEKLAKLFHDNFQMSFYAIQEARSRIYAGKEVVPTGLLEEIKRKMTKRETVAEDENA